MKATATPKPVQKWKAQQRVSAHSWIASRGKLSTPIRKANLSHRRTAYGRR